MQCPSCHNELKMADRQGIEIDYCPSCRGVWLDRGELDKIIERTLGNVGANAPTNEARPERPVGFIEPPVRQAPMPQAPPIQQAPMPPGGGYRADNYRSGYRDDDDDDDYKRRQQHDQYGHDHHKRRKRKSFLEEIFDFD